MNIPQSCESKDEHDEEGVYRPTPSLAGILRKTNLLAKSPSGERAPGYGTGGHFGNKRRRSSLAKANDTIG